MGLSNEERLSGLYYAIDSIVEIGRNLKEGPQDYFFPKRLIDFIDQLWHAFLGKNSNAAHWVLGSSSGNTVTWGTSSAWGIAAINHHTQKILKTEEDIFKKPSGIFDAFEGFLDIPGLLHSAGRHYKAIYNVFAWTEQAIYYLRRYDDELLKDLEPLSKITSDIQGECFHLFKSDDHYARAYILNLLCKMLYCDSYPYSEKDWDPFTKFLQSVHGQHDLNRLMNEGDLKTLAELHVKMHRAQKDKKLTLMLRAETFIILAGHRFHYEHNFKKMITELKGSINTKDISKLQGLFNKCKMDHEKREKESQTSYRDDQMSPLSIYDICMDF